MDITSLCNAMPFMVGCTLWEGCKVRWAGLRLVRTAARCSLLSLPAPLPPAPPRRVQPLLEQKNATTGNSLAFGTYCGMPSLVGSVCAGDPSMSKMKGCEAYNALCAPGSAVAACKNPGVAPAIVGCAAGGREARRNQAAALTRPPSSTARLPPSPCRPPPSAASAAYLACSTYEVKAAVDAICAAGGDAAACATCASEGRVFGAKCPDPTTALAKLCDGAPPAPRLGSGARTAGAAARWHLHQRPHPPLPERCQPMPRPATLSPRSA